jgi:hypothetical protein
MSLTGDIPQNHKRVDGRNEMRNAKAMCLSVLNFTPTCRIYSRVIYTPD